MDDRRLTYQYTFDDVLIAPAFSDIESRTEISTYTEFLGMDLRVPIVSANMDYVTGVRMVEAMRNLGGLGILNRFYPWEEQKKDVTLLAGEGALVFFSTGIRDLDETFDHVVQLSPMVQGICIDVAHGHHKKVGDLIHRVRSSDDALVNKLKIIAGNVATREGTRYLIKAGADAVKVGIGAGSVCTTRTVAGIGVPQLSAVLDCVSVADEYGIPVIADGGIRNSGDVAKALAAGASMVMVGNLFAGADETPGETFFLNGKQYKRYRGQASFGANGERYVKEGIDGVVPVKGPVAPILRQIQAGIQASMSYVGARNLEEFRYKAKLMEVSSHTLMENSTRVTEILS